MGAPYSEDLRLRVLAAIDEGLSKWRVHRTFKVSRSTIDDWLKLRVTTGSVRAKTAYYRGRRPALNDSPELRAFIEAHCHSTLGEMVAAWKHEKGKRLGVTTFHKTLKRLGYTRKKRVTATRSVIPRSELPSRTS